MKDFNDTIDNAAREVVQYVENVMDDLASSLSFNDLDGKWKIRADELKKKGIRNRSIIEAIAEEMYEDKDVLYDLTGDQIYDQTTLILRNFKLSRDEIENKIAEKIKETRRNHTAMVEAMNMLINKWNEKP